MQLTFFNAGTYITDDSEGVSWYQGSFTLKPVTTFFLLAKFIFRRQLYCRPMRHFCYCCRRDKLWICMEYCGGGSLQDIYHSEFVISIDRYSHHCSLLASDWLSICTIKWWLNLQICFIREQIETATGTFQGKLFTYTQYTVWCYRMLR